MRKRLTLCLFLSGILGSVLHGQKTTKLEADHAYKTLGYSSSADLYEQVGEERLNAPAKIRLGDSYRLSGNTESAEYWYAQAVEETGEAKDILHYAQVLQSNGKCEEAVLQYNEYLTLVEETEVTPRATLKDCSELDFTAQSKTAVTNMEELNSEHLDFSPIPYKGGVVFTSNRGRESSNTIDQWTNDNFTDLYYAEKGQAGRLKAPTLLKGKINEQFHDGTATFARSGKRIYFTRNSEGKSSKEVVDLKIYSADLVNGEWTNIKSLSFNSEEYATCHPTLSEDGRHLYFASNRPGGMGGMDLYVVVKRGEGWSGPRNLGALVNTSGNEVFPFISKEDQLFFASDGHQGLGGLDLYMAEKTEDGWGDAENIGAPYNSIKDDFGFSMLNNGKEGYFASNRAEGLGGDDIYHWTSDELAMSALNNANTISVIEEGSGARIPEAMITIAEGVVADFSAQGTAKDGGNIDNSAHPISFLTDKRGIVQPSFATGKTYTIAINKPGYNSYKKVVSAYELLKEGEWIVALSKREGVVLNGEVLNKKYERAVPNAVLTLFNFCTGEKEKLLSDSEGKFTFFLDCKCDYELLGEKERFRQDKKTISTIDINCEDTHPITTTLHLNIGSAPTSSRTSSVPTTSSYTTSTVVSGPPVVNTPPPAPVYTPAPPAPTVIKNLSEIVNNPTELSVGSIITLDNLYYDYDKFFIRPDAAEELNKVVELMRQNPTIELELSSHTDSRGRRGYNQTLSQKRANVAVNYIGSKGISRSRLTARGLGEDALRNHCADGVECSESEHQENRRTEVKVIKK